MDDNGFLHVEGNNLTKVGVFPYLGREVPNCQELGLDADSIYQVLRPEDELRKATTSFNRVPCSLASTSLTGLKRPSPASIVLEAQATRLCLNIPYVKNSMTVFNAEDIESIRKGF